MSALAQSIEKTPYRLSCCPMSESNIFLVPQGANGITARLRGRKSACAVPQELYGDTVHTRQTSKRQ